MTGLSLRHIRDSTKAWIEVTLPEGTNEVSLYAQDPESLHFDDVARPAGLAESGLLAVDPGVYRLRVMRTEDHMWCEVDLVLLTPGREHAGRVVVTDEPTRASAGRDTINAVLVAPDADVSDMLLVAGAGAFGVAPFLIDRTEVSNADYRAFVDATGYPEPSHWRFIDDFEAAAALPVVMVSFHDACAYARWRGKRLPTWAEWQAGARGDSASVYPPRFDLEKHAIGMTAVPASPITVYLDRFLTSVRPTNEPAPWDDPNGVLHTFSNVRELTSSIDQANVDLRIAGRAWSDATTGMTLADFTTHPLYTISGEPAGGPRVGFRCARSLP